MQSQRQQRVVILGGGFAGVYAYLELHRKLHGTGAVHITLVSEGDRFEFIPLIHEVATGSLMPSGVTQSLRSIPQCCLNEFIQARVIGVDFDKKLVHIEGEPTRSIEYDYLVLALGSVTSYLGVPGAEEYAFPIKSLGDAIAIKNQLITNFEEASKLSDIEEQRALLRFVVVGGGPTGVEMAGEFADFISDELARAFPSMAGLASVVLIERGDRVLKKGVHPWFGEKTQKLFEKKRLVYVMYNTNVLEVTKRGVETSEGFVASNLVVWSAGVKAVNIPVIAEKCVEYDERTDRIKVKQDLSVPSYSRVFVAGDMAWICDIEHEQPYPMRAQFAVREGKHVARNIISSMRGEQTNSFRFKEKAMIVSIGKGGSLAEVFGFRFTGWLGWLIYRGAYLATLVGARAKWHTFIEWTLNLFYSRGVSKL